MHMKRELICSDMCRLMTWYLISILKVRTAWFHYHVVIMGTIASQITSITIVYSTVYSDADQRKHQSSASLAFVRRIHRDRWIPRTKGQLRGKCFHLMTSSYYPIFGLWAHKPSVKFVVGNTKGTAWQRYVVGCQICFFLQNSPSRGLINSN